MDEERTPLGDDPDDLLLLEELGRLVSEVDSPPEHVLSAARESFDWRNVDAEVLAILSYDSIMEDQLVGARGSDGPRFMVYEAPGVTVEVEVIAVSPRQRRLLGQVVPSHPARLEVRHREGTASVTADELGRFTVHDIAAGPVQLICRIEEGNRERVAQTDWNVL